MREFSLTSRGAKASQVFKFKSNNSSLDGLTTLLKSVQHNPLRSEAIHVDFLKISEDHTVTVSVPVELVGECLAVKQNVAFLNQTIYEVTVECFPSKIPDVLQLDISALTEGDSLNAGQIKLPEGVKLKTPASSSIVSALAPMAEEAAPTPAATDAAAATSAEGAATGAAAAPAKGK
jgi:large subunit ribosomal protein L25